MPGDLLALYRGGSDESTLGPKLTFIDNKVTNCNTMDSTNALIQLTGIQKSKLASNLFTNCNSSESGNAAKPSTQKVNGKLILYTDLVRANHIFHNNAIVSSGTVHLNKFVNEKGNTFDTK
jgi:hypothetical protein